MVSMVRLRDLIGFSRCSQNLEVLERNHSNLHSIPDDAVRSARTLKEIQLNDNNLKELPKGFFKLINLERVSLESNCICWLPREVGQLINLVEVNLSRNELQEIPDTIGTCSKLESLMFSHNRIERLPSAISKLQNLTNLELNCCDLVHLPASIGRLSNLTKLEIRENLLESLPDSICNLSNLVHLDLEENQIHQLPVNFGQLKKLRELILDKNEISVLPESFGNLESLIWVDLCANRIEYLPENFKNLKSLEIITLSKNFLERLPHSIGDLRKLSILKVDQNRLIELTPSIGLCEELTELVLTENLLSTLPDSVASLTRLTNLMVDRNRLFNLPQNIGNLSELRTLHVRQNELTFLPESVSNCKQLKVIDLAENELLFLPSGVQNLDLRAIWLSENQNKPLVSFHEEHINLQGSGQKVLSCYLLPQKKKSAGVIIRRSIIDSDDRLYHLPMGQRNSVHFHPDFPAECESDDSSFALHRHHTPSRSMLRDFSETAKNLGAHIAKRNSMTRMEGKSDLLDLTNSIDEDEEPGDTDDDQDSTLCSQNIREERSLRSSMSSLPPNEEGINANIPGIVIPEDLIDIPKISPKVKLRKKPTCQTSFSNTSQASRHSMKEIHDAVYALEAQAVAQAPNSTPCLNASEELERTIEECNASLGQIITEMTENLQKEQIDKRESITKPVSIISSSRMTSLGGFQSYRSSIIHSTSFSSSSTFSDEEDLLYIDSDDESQEKSKSQSQPSLESQIEELATLITEKCFSEAKDLLEIEAAKREESIQQLAKTIVTSALSGGKAQLENDSSEHSDFQPSSTGSARSSRIQQQTFGTFWVHNSE